jgi:hypothetical protein
MVTSNGSLEVGAFGASSWIPPAGTGTTHAYGADGCLLLGSEGSVPTQISESTMDIIAAITGLPVSGYDHE